jgi:hypothetical protein
LKLCKSLVSVMVALIAAPAAVLADALQIIWGTKIEVAEGGGRRGPWLMNESEFHYVDDPTVAITDGGIVGVAWVDQARKDVFFQTFGPDGQPRLEQPVNISRSPQIFSWLPRVAMSTPSGDEVHVLWQEIVFAGGSHGGEIFYARSSNGGRTFTAPINLSHTTGGAGKGRLTKTFWHNGSLDLVIGPEGNLYAAWTEYEGSLLLSRSTNRGASFSAPKRIAGGRTASPARGPALAVDAAGAVYLAWAVGEDPAADIHLARSTDHGRSFGRPKRVHRSRGHADAPKIAVDKQGVVHLVYAESPDGMFRRYHVLHTRSGDGGRTFETPQKVSGTLPAEFASEHFPALSLDGEDNLYLIWELFAPRTRLPRGLAFSMSSDAGRTFATPAVVPGSVDLDGGVNGSLQGLLMRKLAMNQAGAIAVVNSTFWWDKRSHIWLLRGQSAQR